MAPTQTIGGKNYQMYTPEWYAAMDGNKVHDAGVTGEAAGMAAGTASRADFAAQYPGYGYPPPGDYSSAPTPPTPLSLTGLQRAGGSGGSGGSSSSGFGSFNAMIPGANPSRALANLTDAANRMGDSFSTTPYTAPDHVTGAGAADDTAARSAIFARTKDTAAKTASASMSGLSEALGARGLTGGGYEAGQIGGTLAQEANTIGEGDRQQAESELTRANSVADRNYAGDVAQRTQDLQAKRDAVDLQNSQASLQLEQRKASLAGLSAALTGATQRY